MGIENTGNAPTAPSKVQMDIYDRRGNVVLETVYNTNTIDEILPFETRDAIAFLPTRLPPGAYLVKYSVFRFEDDIKRSGELTLSVLPEGTLATYEGYGIDGLSFRDKLTIIIPLAIVLIVGLGLVLILWIRRKNAKRRRQQKGVSQYEEQYQDDDDDYPQPPRRQMSQRPVRRMPEGEHGVVDLSRRNSSR
jgi:hypothetical protein